MLAHVSFLFLLSNHVQAAPHGLAPRVRPLPGLALSHKPCSYPVSSPAPSPGRLIDLLDQDVRSILLLIYIYMRNLLELRDKE